jgi:hypothetical protein
VLRDEGVHGVGGIGRWYDRARVDQLRDEAGVVQAGALFGCTTRRRGPRDSHDTATPTHTARPCALTTGAVALGPPQSADTRFGVSPSDPRGWAALANEDGRGVRVVSEADADASARK